jgi:hypothetical protein
VKRFQAQYGFDQVGRVGPLTRDKINDLISHGGWVVSDISGPWMYFRSHRKKSRSNIQSSFAKDY